MSLFHSHSWRVQGAVLMDKTIVHIATKIQLKRDVTEVLQVCQCGSVRTITLDGHWTIEQLTYNSAAPISDDTFLKKLKIKL